MYPPDPHGVKKWGDMTPQLLWVRRPWFWSVDLAAVYVRQTGDVCGRRCWRQVGRDRPGIQQPCCADTCEVGNAI